MPGESGELLYFGVALVAFVVWSPALATTFFASRYAHDSLRRRGASSRASRGFAAAVAVTILVVYAPIYTLIMIGLFELAYRVF